jgi:hypothetical protein
MVMETTSVLMMITATNRIDWKAKDSVDIANVPAKKQKHFFHRNFFNIPDAWYAISTSKGEHLANLEESLSQQKPSIISHDNGQLWSFSDL